MADWVGSLADGLFLFLFLLINSFPFLFFIPCGSQGAGGRSGVVSVVCWSLVVVVGKSKSVFTNRWNVAFGRYGPP